MVKDEFALEQFKSIYGHMFEKVEIRKDGDGHSLIVASYTKPRMKLDWVPGQFCRRKVRLVRIGNAQKATETPKPATA